MTTADQLRATASIRLVEYAKLVLDVLVTVGELLKIILRYPLIGQS